MNHPMQGTAADIMKLAMIEVDRRLRAEGFASAHGAAGPRRTRLRGARRRGRALSAMACEAMAGVAELAVPLDVSRGERRELGGREVGEHAGSAARRRGIHYAMAHQRPSAVAVPWESRQCWPPEACTSSYRRRDVLYPRLT